MLKKELLSTLTQKGKEALISKLRSQDAELEDVVTLKDIAYVLGKRLNKDMAIRVYSGGKVAGFFVILVDKDVADIIDVCKLDEDENNLGALIIKDKAGNNISHESVHGVLLDSHMVYSNIEGKEKMVAFLHKDIINEGCLATVRPISFDEIVAELA